MPSSKSLLFLTSSICLPGVILGQTDDFNDGDDAGWTRQDSLGIILESPFATFGFSDGGYRISADASPDPEQMGPSRAASFRQDVSYNGRVFLSADLKIANPLIQQSVGFLAFVQPNPTPGAVFGYSLSFQPLTGDIVLNRIENELPTRLKYAGGFGASDSLRLILIGENGNFSAAVYNLDDLVNPIAQLTANDTTFSSGTAGLFVFSDTDDGSGPIDAIFDNYRANPITNPELQLTLHGESGFKLTWPDWAVHFSPTFSTTLAQENWPIIQAYELGNEDGFLFHIGDRTSVPKKFFRLERRPF